MVKNSVPRHSKSKRDPVTLDLEAEAADDETQGEKDSKQNASPDAGSVGAAAESSTMRVAVRGPFGRAVSVGSSNVAVPLPTIIASTRPRIW